MDFPPAVLEVREVFDTLGRAPYESGVTHLEHALQAAFLAEKAKAGSALVAAALLHDIGHLLLRRTADAAAAELGQHDSAAADWLSQRFTEEVTEPARLHVAAKRYLCAMDPAFEAKLSSDSRTSLMFQGGPFTRIEAEAFVRQPFAEDAIRLREWDDAGKTPGLETPALDHFLCYLLEYTR